MEICLKVTGDSKKDMTFEETLKHVKAKESGKRSKSRLMGHSTTSTTAAFAFIGARGDNAWSINTVYSGIHSTQILAVTAENRVTDVVYRNV